MHISFTAFLLTLLSASTFAAPIDDGFQVDTNTTDTSTIEARGVHGYISAYPSAACIGKQVGAAPDLPGKECVKWSPLSDWVGINWVCSSSLFHSSSSPTSFPLPTLHSLPLSSFLARCRRTPRTNSFAQSSQVTGGGITVFKDEDCVNPVGSTILAPLNKDATCVHVGQHDGAWKNGWKSVKFSRYTK